MQEQQDEGSEELISIRVIHCRWLQSDQLQALYLSYKNSVENAPNLVANCG